VKHACTVLTIIALSFLLLLLMSSRAYSYIDPGTGSYVFQLLIAGLLGAVFASKSLWRNAKAFLTGRFGKKNALNNDNQ
jgi:hypothetical protein